MVANSIAISSGTCLSQLVVRRPGVAQPGPVIPDRADGAVYWPSSVEVLQGARTDVVFVFATRVQRQGSGALSFKALGSDVFRFEVPRGGVPSCATTSNSLPTAAARRPGVGRDRPRRAPVRLRHPGRLPRQPSGAGGASADGVVDRPHDLAVLERCRLGGRPPRGDERAGARRRGVADVLGRCDRRTIRARLKCGGDFGDTVCSWTSSSPVGPWTRSPGVRVPYRTGSTFQYAPMAHPEIPLADKKLAVSYSATPTI